MIASMLEGQRPLMTMTAMDTAPSAYLEYLRVIVNCGRLLRQPAMPADLRQSVVALLARAKPLFCANALNLIVQTMSASVGSRGDQPVAVAMPAFWSATFSQHECRLWVDLVETLLFFWADGGGGSGGGGAAFVESFALGLLDRLAELRAAYASPTAQDSGDGIAAAASIDESRSRAERLAAELSRRLRPQHLLALSLGAGGTGGTQSRRRAPLGSSSRSGPTRAARSSTANTTRKQQRQTQTPTQKQQQQSSLLAAAFVCFLEAAGVQPQPPPSLEAAKAALEGVTIEQAGSALRLHQTDTFTDNLPRLQGLRKTLRCLPTSAADDAAGWLRSLRTEVEASAAAAGVNEPADLGDLLASFAAYASAVCDFEAAWQRNVVKDADAMSPFLLSCLSRVLAGNIGPAKAVPGCWEALPETLRDELEQLSARRLASVSAAAQDADDSDSGPAAPAAFHFDVVVLKQAEIRPEFLSPE
uniref:HECT domain-containing protein n=1 Tax=Macrostomum lignano TaxID=282301 RepID=A0A1I8JIA0_9PLAT